MSDFENRLSIVESHKNSRVDDLKKHRFNRYLEVFVVSSGILVAFALGFFTGSPSLVFPGGEFLLDSVYDYDVSDDNSTVYNVGSNFTVIVRDDGEWPVEGDTVGVFNSALQDKVFLQGDRPIYSVYSTCVHERLHQMGIDDARYHDWINSREDVLLAPMCVDFIEMRYGGEGLDVVRSELEDRFLGDVRSEFKSR